MIRTYIATDTSNVHRPRVAFCAERSHGTHHFTGTFGIVPVPDQSADAMRYARRLADDFNRSVGATASERLILSLDFDIERLSA